MKKWTKRLFSAFLGFLMVLGVCMPGFGESVYAEKVAAENADEQQDELGRKPVSLYRSDLTIDVGRVETDSSYNRQFASLESKYVSPYTTRVKDQNPWGTCWAFAAIAASEASIWKEGLVSAEPDLSELQLAYHLSHDVVDPLGGTEGDSLLCGEGENGYLMSGGNQAFATALLANWIGVVNETTAPYSLVIPIPNSQEDYNNLLSGAKKVNLPISASYESDAAHLENALWVSMKDRNTIKSLIKQYGACATAYYDADEYYNINPSTDINAWSSEADIAVYCPDGSKGTNHAITIVGWDDNYSKNKFGKYKPSSNGAWYVKNSWGAEFGKGGYFWISYEDASLCNQNGYFYDYGKADKYNHNYQYDGGGATGSYPFDTGANIFTVQDTQYLQAVSFYTLSANNTCEVEVYRHCEAGNPKTGVLAASVRTNQTYAGYHTVSLNRSIKLNKGDTFSVIMTIKPKNAEEVPAQVIDYTETEFDWFKSISAAKNGQSYIWSGRSWVEISCEKYDWQNCRIKAFTIDEKNYKPILGDVDGDRKIAVSDALAILMYLADKEVASFDEASANVDKDGRISVADALAILMHLAGKMPITE